jgi:hypothetical protein
MKNALLFWRRSLQRAIRGSFNRANTAAPFIGALVLWGALWALGWELVIPDRLPGVIVISLACLVTAWWLIVLFRTIFIEPMRSDNERQISIRTLENKVYSLEQKLKPKCHLLFDRHDTGCVHHDMLMDGTTGLIVRVLPVCDTATPINNCQGHLNGVYRRKSETDKWEKTEIDERLTLSWGTIGFAKITFPHGLRQYLDVITINKRSNIWPYVQSLPVRSTTVFDDDCYYRLDIFVTGDDLANCSLSLQIKRTASWDKPKFRVLTTED